MDNEKMFELLEKFYGEFSQFKKSVTTELAELKDATKKIELTIESDVNPKIQALLDGHVNHSEQLERIEKEVTRQDEIIMRRIK